MKYATVLSSEQEISCLETQKLQNRRYRAPNPFLLFTLILLAFSLFINILLIFQIYYPISTEASSETALGNGVSRYGKNGIFLNLTVNRTHTVHQLVFPTLFLRRSTGILKEAREPRKNKMSFGSMTMAPTRESLP
jgi:hypothetical protein